MFVFAFCFGLKGFYVWLKYVPGVSFKTNNEPFKISLCEKK